MMRFVSIALLLLLMPLQSLQAADAKQAEIAKKQMEQLAEDGLQTAMSTVITSGSVYPFAQIMARNGEIHTMGKKRGGREQPAEEWASELVYTLRANAENEPKIVAAALTKLHRAKDESGNEVPGLWTLVDHRYHQPFIVFLPLIEQEDGKHKPGKIIYYATEQWLFEPVKSAN